MKTIKRILLSVLLLPTCQILPTGGEQAQMLASTLWTGTKNGLCYLGSQTLNGVEQGGKYCGSLALQAAKATGNFAWKQAQERPYLATGIVACLAVGAYYRKGINRGLTTVNRTINKNPKKSMLAASLASLTSGVLFHQEIKDGLKATGSCIANMISSYLPVQTNS